MFGFLKKQYPFNDDLKHNAKVIFFITLGVFVFLFVYEPFNIYSLPLREKFYMVIALGIITFLSLSVNLLILPSIFPKLFERRKWTIAREIIWNAWILFTIAFSSFLFYQLTDIFNFDLLLIFEIILYSLLPISILIIINRDRLLKINLKTALELNTKLQEKKSIHDKMIFFESDYIKDSLSIKANSILFIKSANNYIEVFWLENDEIKNQLIRSSLKKVEEIAKEFKFLVKCHRSFIVNINKIEKVSGNYQGYKLTLSVQNIQVPVSQNYIPKVKELI